ncbi:prephenate dehydratase [Holdemania massiliensis]|uniref:prephenate dehydratase n=1 Tax=Holdemania massiliensis TaxID=1468449 RepID=UPI003564B1E2
MDKKIKVGYQGAHGTFSEIAVQEFFKNQVFEACNYKNFPSIIADVEKGMIDYALLPVENTTTGIIYRTYDLLKDSDIFAVGEILVRIDEHLIGLPQSKIEDLREVYSHPEPLDQCSGFFAVHPWIKPVTYQDTAKSVEYVAQCQDPTKAALGSWLAAQYYDLPILKERVQDNQLNTTRFFCVVKGEQSVPEADKISMYFVVNHEPGALYEVIRVFAQRGINMLKLESRPIRGRMFEYCFYIDFDGSLLQDKTREAIAEVREHCLEVKVLGSYKRAFNGELL